MKLTPESLRVSPIESFGTTRLTSPLLHHLQGCTEDRATEVGARVAETTGEAGVPSLEVAALGDDRRLVLVVGHDLGELLLDVGRVHLLSTDTRQGTSGIVDASTLDVPPRGLGEEEETDGEDHPDAGVRSCSPCG